MNFGKKGKLSKFVCNCVPRFSTVFCPTGLLLRCRVAIRCGLLGLCLRLGNHVGLMNCSLDNLLLFWVKILREVLIESGLFLL
jgi:hypothetical protein